MRLGLIFLLSLLCVSCESKQPKLEPARPATEQAEEAAEPAAPAVKQLPELALDGIGPKVGFSRVVIKEPRDRALLTAELEPYKEFIFGKQLTLQVERQASIAQVALYLDELGQLGATAVTIRTDTREEFPSEVRFVPKQQLKEPAPCSTVTMILEDRSTAVWKLSGGAASRRARGFGGPDLTMTRETLERFLKGCRDSNLLFVAAHPAAGFGLLFDLAASAQLVPEHKPASTVLLEPAPVAGAKVDL